MCVLLRTVSGALLTLFVSSLVQNSNDQALQNHGLLQHALGCLRAGTRARPVRLHFAEGLEATGGRGGAVRPIVRSMEIRMPTRSGSGVGVRP